MPSNRIESGLVGINRGVALSHYKTPAIITSDAAHVPIHALVHLITQVAFQSVILLLVLRFEHVLYSFNSFPILINFVCIKEIALLPSNR